VIINQESKKAFHRRIPRVRDLSFTVLCYNRSGIVSFVVVESHGNESHLFGDSGGFARVSFSIAVSSSKQRWIRRRRRRVIGVFVVVVENYDSSSGVEACSIGKC